MKDLEACTDEALVDELRRRQIKVCLSERTVEELEKELDWRRSCGEETILGTPEFTYKTMYESLLRKGGS